MNLPGRWTAVWLCLTAGGASAQLVSENAESGALSAPWDLVVKPGITLEPSGPAAHRGSFGIRLVDTEDAIDAAPGTHLERPLAVTTPSLYTRLWVRRVSENAAGGTAFLAVYERGASAQGTSLAWTIDDNGLLVCVEQGVFPDGGIDYSNHATDATLDGGWQLLETAAWGLGGEATVIYAVDGRRVLVRDRVPAHADRYDAVHLGMVYANGPGFHCSLDFDDLRVDTEPMGSRLELQLDGSVVEAQCTPLEVRLMPTLPLSDGGLGAVAAPYDVALRLEGMGAVYSDANCTTTTGSPSLSKGSAQRTFYFRGPDAGSATFTVAHQDTPAADFLGGSTPVAVLSPGAAAPGSLYAIHCQGCTAAPVGLGWLVAVLALRRSRRS